MLNKADSQRSNEAAIEGTTRETSGQQFLGVPTME